MCVQWLNLFYLFYFIIIIGITVKLFFSDPQWTIKFSQFFGSFSCFFCASRQIIRYKKFHFWQFFPLFCSMKHDFARKNGTFLLYHCREFMFWESKSPEQNCQVITFFPIPVVADWPTFYLFYFAQSLQLNVFSCPLFCSMKWDFLPFFPYMPLYVCRDNKKSSIFFPIPCPPVEQKSFQNHRVVSHAFPASHQI